ncbi:hypothetical protein [Pseudomarimonas arenosa]|uniref:Ig-like domain-containing protein n=1 Tax=Pseudomarimonas arenosa TaxID=2774145 RepID=A0AAW3ZKJ3_9GAMM|nr:hypothetical protein [Pseudomarimonas arenosa]MBD8525965.1 hypothetical protein [Pseudomarimonas arenosa]
MHHSRLNPFSLSLLTLALGALAVAAPAVADDDDDRTCDYTDSHECGLIGCYDTKYQDWILPSPQAGYCSYKVQSIPNYTFYKYVPAEPPEPTIACTRVANCTLSCLAQPEGAGLTYTWTKQGPSTFNPQPQSNENTALIDIHTPNSITIRVSITSPYGQQSSPAAWTVVPHSVCFPN